jgi:hypothetical protein
MNDMTRGLPTTIQPGGMAIIRETASTAAAARAKALVEARYLMAMHRPRVWDQVRQDILHECRRPSFANNKSALYRKPVGKGIEGLGIRFAEVALRCMTNVTIETTTEFEDEVKEIVRIMVTDLESNVPYSLDVPITKTVERSKPNDDGSYVSVRKNSYGKDVYTVIATDEDMLNKRGALISKALRTLALRLIPGDIQDEAEKIIRGIRLDEAAKDPDAERKRIADAFAELNVRAADLKEYLGHPLDTCSPAELVNLRGLYSAIRDGEATWAQAMENKETDDPPPPKGDDKKNSTLPALTDESFEKKFTAWEKQVKKGQAVDALIAMVQTKNTLTPAQLAKIRALAPEVDPNTPAGEAQVKALIEEAESAGFGKDRIEKESGRGKDEVWTLAHVQRARAFLANPMGAPA